MTQQAQHFEITRAIDVHLSDDSFRAATRTSANKYQPWYAQLLSSIALLAAGQEVVYAYTDYELTLTDARILVFTTDLVIVAKIDSTSDGVPVAHATRRSSLVGIKLSASEGIDARDGRSYEWPGTLILTLTYSALTDSIEIVADGANHYSVDQPAPVVTLLEGLTADLANSGALG